MVHFFWQGPFVAAFSSSNLGDVSPNVFGPRCINTGDSCENAYSTCPIGGVGNYDMIHLCFAFPVCFMFNDMHHEVANMLSLSIYWPIYL
jgi:hypothetical protein